MEKQTKITGYQSFFYFAILVGLFALTVAMIRPYIAPLVLSAALAIIIYPIYERLVIAFKGYRALAAIFVIAVLVLIVALIISLIGSNVFNEAAGLFQSVQTGGGSYDSLVTSAQMHLNNILPSQFSVDIRSYLQIASAWILAHTGSFFTHAFDLGFKTFLTVLSLFYILKDGPKIVSSIKQGSPLPSEYNESIATVLQKSIQSILLGSLTVAVIQGTISGIGYAIFGVPNPILLAIMTALCALLPVVGTATVIIPTVLFLFFAGHVGHAIGLAIWGIVSINSIDNFLAPRIIGHGIKVHPLLILFSVLGGLSFFGPEGFLLGPVILSLLFAFFDMYHVFNRYEKQV